MAAQAATASTGAEGSGAAAAASTAAPVAPVGQPALLVAGWLSHSIGRGSIGSMDLVSLFVHKREASMSMGVSSAAR